MSTKVERQQIEWRRSKVAELDSQGHSQPEISRILQVSIGTVNRDLSYLRQQAKENIRKYVDERLPEEYEKCLVGLTAILREAWNAATTTEDRREKIQALSLAKDCYSMKLDLLTNATVVEDAIRFVSSNQEACQQQILSSSEEKQEKAFCYYKGKTGTRTRRQYNRATTKVRQSYFYHHRKPSFLKNSELIS